MDGPFQFDWLIHTLDLHVLAYKASVCGEKLGRLNSRFVGGRDFLKIERVRWALDGIFIEGEVMIHSCDSH